MRSISKFQLACRFDNFFNSSSLFGFYPSASLFDFYLLQTVAVIPVLPHGVLQLGSSMTVSNFCSVILRC